MVRGAAGNHVVPRPDAGFHPRPVETEAIEILAVHQLHELFDGVGRDDIVRAVSNQPLHQFPITEQNSGSEADFLFVAEGGHVVAARNGQFPHRDLPIHYLPRILAGLLEHAGDEMSRVAVGQHGAGVHNALSPRIEPER